MVSFNMGLLRLGSQGVARFVLASYGSIVMDRTGLVWYGSLAQGEYLRCSAV